MKRILSFLVVAILLASTGSSANAQEEGFKQIFDGKSLDGWRGKRGAWKVEDGVLIGETTPEKPLKDNTFLVWQGGDVGDFEMRFKFRISGEGANSGIQFRCTQEPSGHLVGYQADIDLAGKWLGSIYDEKTGRKGVCDRGEKVTINDQGERTKQIVADKEELFKQISLEEFNEYAIKAIGNHITISINGNVTAELHDTEKGHADLSGVLGLQLHTGPPMKIEFKDIRMKQFLVESDPDGFKPIFNGKTLAGWTGDEKLWRVEEGAIVGQTTEENKVTANQFLVWDQGEVDDFCLKLKFKLSGTERANSGVQYRSQIIDGDQHRLSGYQADIDKTGKFIGITYSEKTGRGILCQRGQKVNIRGKKDKDVEQSADAAELLKNIDLDGWNEMEVTARGNHFVTKINGNVTSEVVDEEKAAFVKKGLIGFQLHVGPPMKVEFKDVKLKRLDVSGTFAKLKKVVFIAGKKSHGYGKHEHNAGCMLLAKALEAAAAEKGLKVITTVYNNGWPTDPTALDNADSVVVYCDGGGRHFLHHNGEAMDDIMRRGVGLACIHYGVEVPKGDSGGRFLNWIGGYFETDWSVNPHWVAKFESLPEHPVTRGVNPFEINDEWYYHMRFSKEMTRVTPLLSAMPPKETLKRKDGPHSGNPHVRKAVLEDKKPQHLAWAYERGDGKGRGFGFTGGHYHDNWRNDDFRKLVLNAIVWTAHAEVPKDGVESATPTDLDLEANQDYPKVSQKKKSK